MAFIKVTEIYKNFFSDIESEDDIIVNLDQVKAIGDDKIYLGESTSVKLTPESMKSLKEYIEIECKDCTGKED